MRERTHRRSRALDDGSRSGWMTRSLKGFSRVTDQTLSPSLLTWLLKARGSTVDQAATSCSRAKTPGAVTARPWLKKRPLARTPKRLEHFRRIATDNHAHFRIEEGRLHCRPSTLNYFCCWLFECASIGVLMRGLRVLLRTSCVFLALSVVALAVMFGGRTMCLGSLFVMLGGLVVLVSGHEILNG